MLESFLIHASLRHIFILIAITLLAVYLVKNHFRHRKIRTLGGYAPGVPRKGPFGTFFVWDAIASSSRNESLRWWTKILRNAAEGSPTIESNVGGTRFIATADPENIKAILATQFTDYGKGEEFNRDWHDFLGDSIFTTDHDEWHQSRALIRPQFIKDRLSDLEIFERHVSTLLDKLSEPEVDVAELFHRYTLDVSTDFLLGRSVGSLKTGSLEFAHAFGEIQRLQNNIARAGTFAMFMSRKAFNRHLVTLNSFVEPFIEDALALSKTELENRTKSDSGYTFLHALAAHTRDRKFLRDQLVAVLLAGRDTTANTLSWLFYELSRNPEIVAQLRYEIEEVVGWQRIPTYEHLKSMKFLQNSLNETLRLYPVLPFNVRLALKDTTLPRGAGPDGESPIGVLKGTPVAYSIHNLHLTRSIYPPESSTFPSPVLFAPSRWQNWQPKPWTYIPFNGGPRICVGQQFALMEMSYTVVRILQRFARVESRMESAIIGRGRESRLGDKGLNSGVIAPGMTGRGNSLADEFFDSRELGLKTDILLAPADKVMMAFHGK